MAATCAPLRMQDSARHSSLPSQSVLTSRHDQKDSIAVEVAGSIGTRSARPSKAIGRGEMPLGFLTLRERDAVRLAVKGGCSTSRWPPGTRHEQDHRRDSGSPCERWKPLSSPIWSDLLRSLTRIAETQSGSCESCIMPLRSSVLDAGAIVSFAKRLLRFHANFERIFERPKFRPSFHA